jgi:uncharacterized protein YcbX
MTVSKLSVTPVKGLAIHHPDAVDVGVGGVVGDRAFFLVDAAGEMTSCTDLGALVAHRADYDEAAGVLAVHGPDGLLRSATVELGAATDTDFYELDSVDSRRFRMNVEIAGAVPLAEDTWAGRELRIGDAVVRAGGQVKRCAATTRNPDTGDVDLQTLKMIGALKGREDQAPYGPGFYLGVYAEVLTPGRVAVGDAATLV